MSKPYGIRARLNSITSVLKKRFGQLSSRLGEERHLKAGSAIGSRNAGDKDGPVPANELSVAAGTP